MSNLFDYMPAMKQKYQVFTSGTSTWTKPSGIVGDVVRVTMIGGGGGGAWASSAGHDCSGGNGGVAIQEHPVTVSGNVTVTIGTGGAARGGSAGDGSAGVSSTFGSLATAAGGSGGRNSGTSQNTVGSAGALVNADPSGAWVPSSGYSGRFGGPHGFVKDFNNKTMGGGGLRVDGVAYGYGGVSYNGAPTAGGGGVCVVEWWEYV